MQMRGQGAPEAADLGFAQAQDLHELLHVRRGVPGVRRHQVLLTGSLLLYSNQPAADSHMPRSSSGYIGRQL